MFLSVCGSAIPVVLAAVGMYGSVWSRLLRGRGAVEQATVSERGCLVELATVRERCCRAGYCE